MITFKPGFHKAAMEYVRFVGAKYLVNESLAGFSAEVNLLRDHTDKDYADYRKKERELFGAIAMAVSTNTHIPEIFSVLRYLAHTELHGWDE